MVVIKADGECSKCGGKNVRHQVGTGRVFCNTCGVEVTDDPSVVVKPKRRRKAPEPTPAPPRPAPAAPNPPRERKWREEDVIRLKPFPKAGSQQS